MKPAAVLDYNKYATGVDRSDQMLSYYSFERKTLTLQRAVTGPARIAKTPPVVE
jgi:hypothetical protein